MKTNLSKVINIKLDQLLESVGDMSLKRRARKVILGLDLKEKDTIVDLGCGDGFFLYLLSNLPIKLNLIGYDSDELVLMNAKRNLSLKKIELINGSITSIPFKRNKCTKVILTEVLEHVEDDKKALSEVYRILKPKGTLLLTVPNYNFPFFWDPINWVLQNLFGTHISGTNFFAGIWARHLRLYKRERLKKLLEDTGFKIQEIEELTSRCLPFSHYLVNLVARFLYNANPPAYISAQLSKFKSIKRVGLIKFVFFLVNKFDKLNDILPGKNGLHIYVKARKQ